MSMKRTTRTAAVFTLSLFCLCSGVGATVVTIQIPGGSYVTPFAMNNNGEVTGNYVQNFEIHGFVWKPDGTLETFDVPGDISSSTISATGVVTGYYYYSRYGALGFVRAADGTITTLRVPHGPVTEVFGGNSQGWSVGGFSKNMHTPYQAFLRSPSGKTTEFSVPGAAGGAYAKAVNSSRVVAGEAAVLLGHLPQGFVRAADGTTTMFGDPDVYMVVSGMNDAGTIVGSLQTHPDRGFFRTSDGTLTVFDAPNAKSTDVGSINNSGTIVGAFTDANDVAHGFIRAASGTFTTFDVPGAISTEIAAINNKGVIAGTFQDKNGVTFGFTGKP